MSRCWFPRGIPSLSWISFSILSLGSTLRVMVFPVWDFTKNCMMLRNLYCFSRNKWHKLSLFKDRKRMASKEKRAIQRSSWWSVVVFFASPFYCFSPLCLPCTTHFFDRWKSQECSFCLRDCFYLFIYLFIYYNLWIKNQRMNCKGVLDPI